MTRRKQRGCEDLKNNKPSNRQQVLTRKYGKPMTSVQGIQGTVQRC